MNERDSSQEAEMHFHRWLTLPVAAVLFAACGKEGADQSPVAETPPGAQSPSAAENPPQVILPQTLCDLLPQAEAERIMGKSLVEQRNDEWACHYQDAIGTTGTGLWVDLNAFLVSDQCRLTPDSEPLSGIGDEACIAPHGIYTIVVFGSGGQTFEVTAPGEDRSSELATAVAKEILSKLGS